MDDPNKVPDRFVGAVGTLPSGELNVVDPDDPPFEPEVDEDLEDLEDDFSDEDD